VQRAADTSQSQASRKAQSLALSLPDEPVWVNGDSVLLEQIVVNLLNNAVKYTDWGGEIRVALHVEADEALLLVRDNGVGIAPEMLPRIFDLFTQADRSLDRAQGGLGIGLALVQSLVTMHGGRVEGRSTVGVGSEFIVRLPVLLSPHESTTHTAKAAVAASHKMKVLVVDDSGDAAQSAVMLLETLGHDARIAPDGGAAMKMALEYVPDLILLDIGLPGVDGLQVAKWIRNQPALKHAVLIAVTGYGRESDRERSREAGFDQHLVKPVDFARIESILSAGASKAD
jgi:CheY-like chemotaxis protein